MTNGVTMVRRAVLALILLLLADPAWSQNIDGQAGGGASLTLTDGIRQPNCRDFTSSASGTVKPSGKVTFR